MRKLLLIAVLTLSLSLIVGVALAQEGDIESLVVAEDEAKEGDIIEVRALSEAKPSDFIALGTSVKRVMEDFQEEAKALGLGELALEEGEIIIVKGVPIPLLSAPVKGDKIQDFAYLPENMLTSGREAMGIILEIVEGRKMTIKIEGKEFEMDLETGKIKVITMGPLGNYWTCMGKCIANEVVKCKGACKRCIYGGTHEDCALCFDCGKSAIVICGLKCL